MAYTQKKGKYWYAYVKTPDSTKPDGHRYKCYTKDPESGTHWTTKTAAKNWAVEHEIQVNKRNWIDPALGKMTWDQFWSKWSDAIDVEPSTRLGYTSNYDNHIGPKFGETAIGTTDPAEVDQWLRLLRDGKVETGVEDRRRTRTHLPDTVNKIRMQMRLMLQDAVAWKLLDVNPLPPRTSPHRGRRAAKAGRANQNGRRPKLLATPEQVLGAAVNMHQVLGPDTLAGFTGFMRVLTAGWTGMRPGEQAALDRKNCHLDWPLPTITVDDEEGSWDETRGMKPELKAPKGGIGRDVLLAPGYSAVLAAWLEYLDSEVVFPDPEPAHPGERWLRHNWNYRWGQASRGGILTLKTPGSIAPAGDYVLERATPGLEYKGLRRVNNVWMTERGVPEVARSKQLGHAMDSAMQAAYSEMSVRLQQMLVTVLQELWVEAFTGYPGVAALEIIRRFAPGFGSGRRGRQLELI
jgi:hypothetical protein